MRRSAPVALAVVALSGFWSSTTAGRSAPGPATGGVELLGHSVDGRPLVAHVIGDRAAPLHLLVVGAIHGDEPAGEAVTRALRRVAVPSGVALWLVDDFNPDGRLRDTRQNAHGVDLNRNYPRNWKRMGGATNSGPRAASEPETRAIMAFLRKIHPNYVVSFHQPLKGVGRTVRRGSAFVQRLHRGLGLPVKAFNCSGVCHGTMTEWFNANFRGVAVTVEYGRGLSRRQATRTGPAGLLRSVGAHR